MRSSSSSSNRSGSGSSSDEAFKLGREAAPGRALANALTPSPAAAGAAGALVTARPASEQAPAWAGYAGIADWASLPEPVQRALSEYFLATTVDGKAAARVALRAAQSQAYQSVGAVTVGSGLVTSMTRPREAEASPAREPEPRAGRGSRGLETRDRTWNRVPVDPGRARGTDGLNGLGDDDDMQGLLQLDDRAI